MPDKNTNGEQKRNRQTFHPHRITGKFKLTDKTDLNN